MVEQCPSSAELSERFTGELAAAELRFKSVVTNVDARVAFAGYALSRLAAPDSSMREYARPTPAGVEHAAWLLYPEFDKSSTRDGARIQEVIDAIEAHGAALNFTEIFRRGTTPIRRIISRVIFACILESFGDLLTRCSWFGELKRYCDRLKPSLQRASA